MKKVKEAIKVILSDTASYPKSLNYAVNYCKHAMGITDEREMEVQVLYILENIIYWRHPRAKEVRQVLKDYVK